MDTEWRTRGEEDEILLKMLEHVAVENVREVLSQGGWCALIGVVVPLAVTYDPYMWSIN